MAGVVAQAPHADDAARPHDGRHARRCNGRRSSSRCSAELFDGARLSKKTALLARRRQGCNATSSPAACASAPTKFSDLEGLRARFAARLRIAMNGEADAKRLQQVLAPTAPPAVAPARCRCYRNSTATCEVALGDAWRVRPDSRLIASSAPWLTPENVQFGLRHGRRRRRLA